MDYIKHIINKLKVRNLFIIIIPLFIIIIILPRQANAFNPVAWIADQTIVFAAANFVGMFKGLFLGLLQTVVSLLTNVMAYQNFFSEGVNAGWTITRDFSNLFFALTLLIIAIATVLNVGALDNYTAKRMLPNFIFVALLINFSKAIVGFLIDISQIIMVSFYNSFGPNMANIIGNASRIAETGSETNTETMMLNIFTITIIAILVFTLLWTALILAMRIVNLWFVIMMAPLAFMANLVPGLKAINDDWKNRLQESLITGPTLMFLLYWAFSLMSIGISANTATTGGDNLLNNGNLINYVLVILLLLLANTTATKAGQAAPAILQKAVGVAGTIATLGVGAYVGAGGYNTNQLRKKTIELGDKGIGVVTNITGQNAKYEAAKKDFRERQASATGMFGEKKVKVLGREINVNPLSYTQGFTAEGKKNIQEDYEIQYAADLAAQKKLDEKGNERYKKIFNADLAKEIKELTDDNISIAELREKLFQAKKKDNLKEKMALITRITELGKLGELGKDDGSNSDTNNFFVKLARENGSEGEFMEALVSDVIETNNAGVNITDTKIAKNLRDRLERVGGDKKGQKGFVGNINKTPRGANPQVLATKVIEKGIVSGIEDINNNPNLMRERVGTPGNYAFVNGSPEYKPADQYILDFIESGNLATLQDPKTWQKLNKKSKDEFLTVLTAANIAASVAGSPNARNQPKYVAAINAMTN